MGKAFIVINEGHDVCDQDITSHCSIYLAKYKIPKQIIFINELPKTDSGKINHKILKNL